MCGKIAKYGLITFLCAAAGAILIGFIALCGFVALWYAFPGDWKSLSGLPDAPRDILALETPGDRFLVRTAGGQLFTCMDQTCAPADQDWSTPAVRCDESNRPVITSFLPTIVNTKIKNTLGCERSYLDTGHSVFIAVDDQGAIYQTGGANLLPVDASILGVGLVGGLIAFLAILFIGTVTSIVLLIMNRQQTQNVPPAWNG